MTINEIARLANTSRGTVDRVINNRGKVRKDLAEKILRIIEETNYKTNEIGRSLSLSNRKILVGAIIGSKKNSFFDLIIDGVHAAEEKYRNTGLQILLKQINLFDKDETIKSIKGFKNSGIEALIVTCLNDQEIIKEIDNLGIPIIALNIDLNVKNKICFIGSDYYNSGALSANFANLILNKDDQLAIVISSLKHSGQSSRVQGFKDKLRNDIKIVTVEENFDDDVACYSTVKQMIHDYNLSLIVFLGAGISGGLKAISDSGSNIRALTVDQSSYVEKGLKDGYVIATITQHPYTQGKNAIEIAHDYLVRKQEIPEQKILDNSIVLKESMIPHKINY